MFDTQFVSFAATPDALEIQGLPILVDADDFEGVLLAAQNLADDLQKVTGKSSPVWKSLENPPTRGIILIGSVNRSKFVRELVEAEDSSSTQQLLGKWESFQTSVQACAWPIAERMLVLAGSDKRGTIFACYTLSEQIGVSPWHWWADVYIPPQERIYALSTTTHQGEPSVQFRGIFINDETPALIDWAHEKFGQKLGLEFYKKVFELLLRMKANFLWPAMWSGFPEPGSIFFTDDPRNQQAADAYGIVISTSHHEPMGRNMSEWRQSNQGEWAWEMNKDAIADFFKAGAERSKPFESVLTLGMRGDSDVEINSENPKATLKDVIQTQRDIIEHTYGRSDGVPQVMALYKEVQEYFEDGLEIPEDVTLLFADDNFGNIRRFPGGPERARTGGYGVYYHLEYVGAPRSYKWLNTNSCGKIHQQLQAAYANDIRKIWVFNVGDIKPQEIPLTFALSLAWNINCVQPSTIPRFFNAFAMREFGNQYGDEASELLLQHDRMMSLRRHEHLEHDTLSISHYREADIILQRWLDLDRNAGQLFEKIHVARKPSFFQLVLHPIRASRINLELRITQAKNQMHGSQRRNTTNILAQRCLDLFDEDWSLSELYHNSPWTGCKWNHIMKQPRYGFSSDTWHAPSRDVITGLSYVQLRQNSNRICGQMGVAIEGHTGIRPGLVNEESDRMQPSRGELVRGLTLPPITSYGPPSRYFEIYTRGTVEVEWYAETPQPWVKLSQTSGSLLLGDSEAHRVEVSIDWALVTRGFDEIIKIDIRSRSGELEQVHLPVISRATPSGFKGFPEVDGYIAIDVGAIALDLEQEKFYHHLPYLGRTEAGGLALAVAPGDHVPFLEYPIFAFTQSHEVRVTLYFTMTLNSRPDRPLCYDIAMDTVTYSSMPLIDQGESVAALPNGWAKAVQDNVWIRTHTFPSISPGQLFIRYRALEEFLVLERIIVDFGGVRESYLGPPPTAMLDGMN
ncbi:hypothetical protein IQ07DRAFT_542687 [Pyrenochaeta sp. DS3sAY3a]|nr:hypothetical protein IQ07DRAFT_542687 [Pyrenochaeta sp. DS3sAY3a]